MTQLGEKDRQRLEQLKATFLSSRFAAAGRRPIAVELPVEAPLGEFMIANKIDAVYQDEDGTIEIVDLNSFVRSFNVPKPICRNSR